MAGAGEVWDRWRAEARRWFHRRRRSRSRAMVEAGAAWVRWVAVAAWFHRRLRWAARMATAPDAWARWAVQGPRVRLRRRVPGAVREVDSTRVPLAR